MWVLRGKKMVVGVLALGCIVLLFLYPEAAKTGAAAGLSLTGQVLVPALFPFMVFSLFITKTGVLIFFEKPFGYLTNRLFRSWDAAAILMGFVGGFPVGGKLIGDAYRRGELTPQEAEARISCGVNAGPAFVITAVGLGMLRSKAVGILLFVAVTGASVVNGMIFSRWLVRKPEVKSRKTPPNEIPAFAFVAAVHDSALSMLAIAGFATLFSAIIYILQHMQLNERAFQILAAVLEVTTGTALLKDAPLPLMAAVIGFGGVSVHCQVLSGMDHVPIRLWVFYLSRLTHAGLSAVFAKLLLHLFPITAETFVSTNNIGGISEFSLPLTLAMMLMSVTLIASIKEGGR